MQDHTPGLEAQMAALRPMVVSSGLPLRCRGGADSEQESEDPDNPTEFDSEVEEDREAWKPSPSRSLGEDSPISGSVATHSETRHPQRQVTPASKDAEEESGAGGDAATSKPTAGGGAHAESQKKAGDQEGARAAAGAGTGGPGGTGVTPASESSLQVLTATEVGGEEQSSTPRQRRAKKMITRATVAGGPSGTGGATGVTARASGAQQAAGGGTAGGRTTPGEGGAAAVGGKTTTMEEGGTGGAVGAEGAFGDPFQGVPSIVRLGPAEWSPAERSMTTIPDRFLYFPPARLPNKGKVYIDNHCDIFLESQEAGYPPNRPEHGVPSWHKTMSWSNFHSDELEAYALWQGKYMLAHFRWREKLLLLGDDTPEEDIYTLLAMAHASRGQLNYYAKSWGQKKPSTKPDLSEIVNFHLHLMLPPVMNRDEDILVVLGPPPGEEMASPRSTKCAAVRVPLSLRQAYFASRYGTNWVEGFELSKVVDLPANDPIPYGVTRYNIPPNPIDRTSVPFQALVAKTPKPPKGQAAQVPAPQIIKDKDWEKKEDDERWNKLGRFLPNGQPVAPLALSPGEVGASKGEAQNPEEAAGGHRHAL